VAFHPAGIYPAHSRDIQKKNGVESHYACHLQVYQRGFFEITDVVL
jgi:hypothetical protein